MTAPAGWSEAALRDACRVVSGGTPKTGVKEYWGGPVPWITPADMSKDRSQVLSRGARSLTELGYNSSGAQLVPPGSVVVSSRAPIGYVAIAGTELSTNQGCKTAVPPDDIDPRYLYWFLVAAKSDLEARASGTTFKEVSARVFGETRLWWPGMAEQHRIVDVLEEQMSRVDAGIAYVHSAKRKLDAIVMASLDRLVGKITDYQEVSTVGAESILVEYGSSSKTGAMARGDDVPVLRMGNVKEGALVWDSLKYLPAQNPEFPRLLLREGDLLFNRTNSAEHVGKSAVFLGQAPTSFASYLIRVRFAEHIDPRWANMVINSPLGRDYVASVVSQQVGQANVNGTKLKRFPLPLISPGEQQRRIEEHSSVLDGVSRMRSGGAAALMKLEHLRSSLLAAAFSGRLGVGGLQESEPLAADADVLTEREGVLS